MLDRPISRRHAVMSSAAALALLAGASVEAASLQPFGKDKDKDKKDPKKTKKFDMTRLVQEGDKHEWTLKVDIDVSAYVEKDKNNMPVSHDFKFDTASIVFPVLATTASHRAYKNELKSKLSFNDVVIANTPSDYKTGLPCGTRLAQWDMKEKTGREVRLEVEIPTTCWQTRFDEKSAELVPWPATWPASTTTTFNDRQAIGRNRAGNDIVMINHDAQIVQELLKTWTNGKDLKSINPVPLAKFLAGQVLEYIQPSGDGLQYQKNSGFEGFDLVGAETALTDRRGTEHDIACALCAIYRAAGLPARIVIGYDLSKEKGKDSNFLTKKNPSVPQFRTWVEFALFDESSPKEVWVPVDVNRQRKVSSRNTGNWKFFGDHDELDNVVPIAHQFHPPAFVVAHGSPCFWGWNTTPNAQIATQFLRFAAFTTPKTANSAKNRQND